MPDTGQARLTIRRPRRPRGGRFVRFSVDIDGELAARLRWSEEVTLDLEPGRHTCLARQAWTKSDPLEINLEAGAHGVLLVRPTGGPFEAVLLVWQKQPPLTLEYAAGEA